MTSAEFVDKLRLIAPSEKSLLERGFDKDFILVYMNGFFVKKNYDSETMVDPLLDLISCYDLSEVDIGMVRFYCKDEVMDAGRFITVGSYDADVIAIDKVTDEVVVLDWESPDYIISRCSKNSETFLCAILEVAKFNKEIFFNEDLSQNQQAIKMKSNEIAEIAGGSQYFNFYLTILGYSGE